MMSTASVMGLNHARRRRSDLMYGGGGYHGRYQGLGACLRQRSTFNFRLQLLFFPPVETCTLAPRRHKLTTRAAKLTSRVQCRRLDLDFEIRAGRVFVGEFDGSTRLYK